MEAKVFDSILDLAVVSSDNHDDINSLQRVVHEYRREPRLWLPHSDVRSIHPFFSEGVKDFNRVDSLALAVLAAEAKNASLRRLVLVQLKLINYDRLKLGPRRRKVRKTLPGLTLCLARPIELSDTLLEHQPLDGAEWTIAVARDDVEVRVLVLAELPPVLEFRLKVGQIVLVLAHFIRRAVVVNLRVLDC